MWPAGRSLLITDVKERGRKRQWLISRYCMDIYWGDWGNPRKSSSRPCIWTPYILSSKQGSQPPCLDVQKSGAHVICQMCVVLDRVAANLLTLWSQKVLHRLFCRCPEHRSCHGMSRWVQAVWPIQLPCSVRREAPYVLPTDCDDCLGGFPQHSGFVSLHREGFTGSALDGGDWSASLSDRFTSVRR